MHIHIHRYTSTQVHPPSKLVSLIILGNRLFSILQSSYLYSMTTLG